MPTKKIQIIDDSAMGAYAIDNYSERVYNKVYFALRDVYGLVAKRSMSDEFDWSKFKTKFAETFGEAAEKRYSLEQLLEYAQRKFGKSLEDLLEINQKTWERREQSRATAAVRTTERCF